MNYASRGIVAWGFFVLTLFSCCSYAEETTQPSFSQAAIAQMVAPIALYPDPLLSQILMASTYPLEVVSAARWLQANPDLKGQALQDALQKQNWDPSVKSLTEVPNVLNMMNEKLDMTTNLGNAFLDQQNQVLDAIQNLRAKAKAAGYLNSGKEQVVDASSTDITIAPADPDTVYVPIYDPNVVYGSWDYPDDLPYSYYPPDYTLAPGTGLAFAGGLLVGNALWGNVNWKDRALGIDPNRYNAFNGTNISDARWSHDPAHREGVPYHGADSERRYGQSQMQAIKSREAFRGHSQELLNAGQNLGGQEARDLGRVQNLGAQEARDFGRGQNFGTQEARNLGALSHREEGEHRSNAFEGINQGNQIRQFSQRGASSLGGGEFHGGGGGFHGGGGGFHGGGGRR